MDEQQFDEKTMPHQFLCPIFQEVMKDPVLTVDGFCFERRAIQQWFAKGKNTNPLTGVVLKSTSLVQNRSLRNVIQHHNTRVRQIERQAQQNANKLIKEHNQRISSLYPELLNELGVLDLDKFTIFATQSSSYLKLLKQTSQKFRQTKRVVQNQNNACKECKAQSQSLKLFKQFIEKDIGQVVKMQPAIKVRPLEPEEIEYLLINSQVIKGIDFRRIKKQSIQKLKLKGILLKKVSLEEILIRIRNSNKIPANDFIRVWITNFSIEQLYNHIVQQVETITGSYLCKVKCVGKKIEGENLKKKVQKFELAPPNYIIIQHGPGQEYVFRDDQAKCDYCYRVKKIEAHCDCKKVFYCSKQCKQKDKAYHENVCKLIIESSNRQ